MLESSDRRGRRSIWLNSDGWSVDIIDQTLLPHEFAVKNLRHSAQAAEAIAAMRVRGAPLIGATAAYGMALAMHHSPADRALESAVSELAETRPTAVNLRWSLDRMASALAPLPPKERAAAAYHLAESICTEDMDINHAIGRHGFELFQSIAARRGIEDRPLRVLTHCNAGALATVDWGTATAPMYLAQEAGFPVHVWVDETRPRNQGAALTAWELGRAGISHELIVDNAGGHLMQHGLVDLVLTGTDRTSRCGDVCNKIGTYLKALAARDNGVPFYVALPGPTIDWGIRDGLQEIPIEERDSAEVLAVRGSLGERGAAEVAIAPEGTRARNHSFDVTPARLVDGLITERGICAASEEGLLGLYPEQAGRAA